MQALARGCNRPSPGGPRSLRWAALAYLAAVVAGADVVRIDNPVGGITIRVVAEDAVRVGGVSPQRELRPGDVFTSQAEGVMVVECRPPDGTAIDLEVNLPYGVEVEATTADGFLSLEGLIARADLHTETGNIEIAVPWRATELEVASERPPDEFHADERLGVTPKEGGGGWKLAHRFSAQELHYGSVKVSARQPGSVVLKDLRVPDDAWIKLPWQAAGVMEDILQPAADSEAPADPKPPPSEATGTAAGETVFRLDVRMVNLMVSVTDRYGKPAVGLGPEDFTVVEDGGVQEIASVSSEEAPFNLAILLDWSGSTRKDRVAMRIAAQRFVDLARPQDKVAVYALATDLFMVVTPLTDDHELAKRRIQQLPSSQGASPIYDAIVLAYDYDLRKHPGERNALIVLSDGVDNQIRRKAFTRDLGFGSTQQRGLPSTVDFDDLKRGAGLMEALIYPIFLKPKNTSFVGAMPVAGRGVGVARTENVMGGTGSQQWENMARDRLQDLAEQSGGRLFRTKSIRDLKPIFPRVTEELRSVYSVAYYPANQDFDGQWRDVEVKVSQPGAAVRTRNGYSAR